MKINELTGIKHHISKLEPGAGHEQWQELLAKQGFRPIGQGLSAQVYMHPKLPYVLKVFTVEDTAYPYWVKLCKTVLLGNPYVPVFRGNLVRINADASAVRMERLSPATEEQKQLARDLHRAILGIRRTGTPWQNYDAFNGKKFDDQLVEAVNYIVKGSAEHTLDLKAANVMSRNGQLVFTDPLA
jgi:hypothetical protein